MSSKLRRLEEILVQAGVEFIDEEDTIGVRVLHQAKPGATGQGKRASRGPKKRV